MADAPDDIAKLLALAERPVGAITETERAVALTGLSARLARPVPDRPRTTVVGSQPNDDPRKALRVAPDRWVPLSRDWDPAEMAAAVDRQVHDNIVLQETWGLDVLSEGELFRNDRMPGAAYINYLAGACLGIGWRMPQDPPPRAPSHFPPVVVIDALRWRGPFLLGDFVRAQRLTDRPVKMNLPGPLSFAQRIMNVHYPRWQDIGPAIVTIMQAEIRTLVAAGCRWIQFDDPALGWARPEEAEFGFAWMREVLEAAAGATTVLHMCRGNPYSLADEGSRPSELPYYAPIAPQVAALPLDIVSVEEPCTEAPWALDRFGGKRIMLGVLDVTVADAEPVGTLVELCRRARRELPADRLMFSPKCGMLHMPVAVASAKIARLNAALARLDDSASAPAQDPWAHWRMMDPTVIAPAHWTPVNATLATAVPAPGAPQGDKSFATLAEAPLGGAPVEHLLKVEAAGDPARPWHLAFLMRPLGTDGVRCVLYDGPERQQQAIIDFMILPRLRAVPEPTRGTDVRVLDADIEALPDGWLHCRMAVKLPAPTVTATLTTFRDRSGIHPGDARYGMTIGRMRLETCPEIHPTPRIAVPAPRTRRGDGHYFLICSQGNAGSVWLAQSLNMHPDITCSVGTDHPAVSTNDRQPIPSAPEYGAVLKRKWMDRIRSRDDVAFGVTSAPARQAIAELLAEKGLGEMPESRAFPLRHDELFDEMERFFDTPIYGNVLGLTIHNLNWMKSQAPFRRHPVALNLIRHPISRFEAFLGRQVEEMAPDATLDPARDGVVATHRPLAEALTRDFGANWSDARNRHRLWALKEWGYFQRWVREIEDFPAAIHVPMERALTDADYFRSLVALLTEGRIFADDAYLNAVFAPGRRLAGRLRPTNRDKPVPAPDEAFAVWPEWLQAAVRRECEALGVARLHAPFGYDFSFMN